MVSSLQSTISAIAGGPGSLRLRPEVHNMKLIAVEEHITFPHLLQNLSVENHASQRLGSLMGQLTKSYASDRLADTGQHRILEMDHNGVAMQILGLSSTINSTHLVGDQAPTGVILAQNVNNELKKAVDANPTRLRAFAELPMHVPLEAAKELRRCITDLGFVGAMLSGSVGGEGKFLDAPEFGPLLSTFEDLEVPLFLHPGVPTKAVWDAYYDIPGRPEVSTRFGLGGWGWHNEVAVHVLRLVLSGTLERHPRLKIIVGHLGEMLPSMMQRVEQVFDVGRLGLSRSVGETLRSQVWISISGFFALAPTQAAIATWGIDKILFGVDYPFVNMNRVGEFMRALGELVSPTDLQKICHTNVEDLLNIKI